MSKCCISCIVKNSAIQVAGREKNIYAFSYTVMHLRGIQLKGFHAWNGTTSKAHDCEIYSFSKRTCYQTAFTILMFTLIELQCSQLGQRICFSNEYLLNHSVYFAFMCTLRKVSYITSYHSKHKEHCKKDL